MQTKKPEDFGNKITEKHDEIKALLEEDGVQACFSMTVAILDREGGMAQMVFDLRDVTPNEVIGSCVTLVQEIEQQLKEEEEEGCHG